MGAKPEPGARRAAFHRGFLAAAGRRLSVAPELLKPRHVVAARARPPLAVASTPDRSANHRHDGAGEHAVHRVVRVEAWRTHAVRGGHVEGHRAAAIVGRGAVSARTDVGLRPEQRLGVGRLQRRVRHRCGRGTADDQTQAAVARAERRLPAVRRREGPDLLPAFQLRALPESAEPGRVLRRCLRRRTPRRTAAGRPAAEILRAVLGVVPHAEDALLPLRLVVELLAR